MKHGVLTACACLGLASLSGCAKSQETLVKEAMANQPSNCAVLDHAPSGEYVWVSSSSTTPAGNLPESQRCVAERTARNALREKAEREAASAKEKEEQETARRAEEARVEEANRQASEEKARHRSDVFRSVERACETEFARTTARCDDPLLAPEDVAACQNTCSKSGEAAEKTTYESALRECAAKDGKSKCEIDVGQRQASVVADLLRKCNEACPPERKARKKAEADAKHAAEREEREAKRVAEREEREAKRAAEREAREAKQAVNRKAREAREAAQREAREARAQIQGGMVRIPAGTFNMGSNHGEAAETPVHAVRVGAFEMDVTEVTVGAYRRCVNAGTCSAAGTDEYCNWGASGKEEHPINCVDWNQANS